jgi:hypothetical protein
MKFCELEKEVLDRISKDWIDSRELHVTLVESGHPASYYDVRVSLDGLQLRGTVEVKRCHVDCTMYRSNSGFHLLGATQE